MSRLILFIVLVLAFFLGACAPGVRGSNATYTINLDKEDPSLTSGATWYMSSNWSPRSFAIDLPRNWNLLHAANGGRYRTNLNNDFKIAQVGLPESWEFRMYSATGIQSITNTNKTDTRVSVEWLERVELVFVTFVPENTAPGTYRGIVTITANGRVRTLPLRITVEGLSTSTDGVQS